MKWSGITFGKRKSGMEAQPVMAQPGKSRTAAGLAVLAVLAILLLAAGMLGGCFRPSPLHQPTVTSAVLGEAGPDEGSAEHSLKLDPRSTSSGTSPVSPSLQGEEEPSGDADAFGDRVPDALAVRSSKKAVQEAPWIATKNTTRINTNNPYEAAVLVSRMVWPAVDEGGRPGAVVLVQPGDWISAVLGADLIHHPNNGPVLFADQNGIPAQTLQELKRLRPKGVPDNGGVQAILVGSLGPEVQRKAEKLGLRTDRITARNAADLARAVDAYYARITGSYPVSVIIGSSDDEARLYTVPAVNWIAHMPEPLLLVSRDGIPLETAQALEQRGGKAHIYILGPEAAVPQETAEQLAKYGEVIRIAGKDPYANAVAFARFKDPKTGFGWGLTEPGRSLSFISSETPSLAPAAAPFAHLGKHSPLVWTQKDSMPEQVRTYVKSLQPKAMGSPANGPFSHAWLTGGTDALTMQAQGEIDGAFEIATASGGIDHGKMDP